MPHKSRTQRKPRAIAAIAVSLLALATLSACGDGETPEPSDPTPSVSPSEITSPSPSEEPDPKDPGTDLDAWPNDLTPVTVKTLKDPVLEHSFTVKQVLVNPKGLPDPPEKTGWLLAQVEVTAGASTMNEPRCSFIQVSRESTYSPEASHQVIDNYAGTLNKVDEYKDLDISPLSVPQSGTPVTGWCLYQVKNLNPEKPESEKPESVDGALLWMHVHRPAMKDPGKNSFPEYVESARIRFAQDQPTPEAEQDSDRTGQ